MAREFITDEISLMVSDMEILKNENELHRMTADRKTQEAEVMRRDLTELRGKYEDKVAEVAALRTILESTAHNIQHGLERYIGRRNTRDSHVSARPAATAPASRDSRLPPPDLGSGRPTIEEPDGEQALRELHETLGTSEKEGQ